MFRKKVFAIGLAVVLALVTTAVALAATVLVDHFETGPQVVEVQVPCNGCAVTSSGFAPGANVLGGERDLVITATGITGGGAGFWNRVQVNTASDGILAMSSDGGVKGEMLVVWDGVDNNATVISTTGLNGLDLTGGGTNGGFIVRTTFDDLPVSATLQVYSNTNLAQATFNIPGNINTNFVDFFVPFAQFTGNTSVLTNAGAIAFYVDGQSSPGADVYFHLLELTSTLEFGDLPEDATHFYSTTLANNGARHEPRTGLRLGTRLDAEVDGQPNLTATGDNVTTADTADDEDGVVRHPTIKWSVAGGGRLRYTVNGCDDNDSLDPCYLSAWIDFNRDGDFGDTGEQIYNSLTVVNGTTPYGTIPIPSGTTFPGVLYARFRICGGRGFTDDCNTPSGDSAVGEVEDYAWDFGPLAVELSSLQAQPTTSPVLPVALVGVSAVVLFSIVFLARRKRTA